VIFAFVQEFRKFHIVVRFIVIRLETGFFAEQEHDIFPGQRFGAVNLEGVILKREAAAVIGFTVVLGGQKGVKVEVRRQRREGCPVLTSRFQAETPVKLPDKGRQGGVGLSRRGNAVQGKPDRQAALQGLPEAFPTPFGLRASRGNKFSA
jgi:hypothetical protein